MPIIVAAIRFVNGMASKRPSHSPRQHDEEDLRRFFGAMRQRAATIRPGAMTSDAMLLAAIFGVGTAGHRFRRFLQVYKKAASSGAVADRPADRVAAAAAEAAVAGAAAVERRDRFGLGWRAEPGRGFLRISTGSI